MAAPTPTPSSSSGPSHASSGRHPDTSVAIAGLYSTPPEPSSQAAHFARAEAAAAAVSAAAASATASTTSDEWRHQRVATHQARAATAESSAQLDDKTRACIAMIVDGERLYNRWAQLASLSMAGSHAEFAAAHAGTPLSGVVDEIMAFLPRLKPSALDGAAPEYLRDSMTQVVDLLSAALFNSPLQHARSCSWCGRTDLALSDCCNSHVLPNSVLKSYSTALPSAQFMAVQRAEFGSAPPDFWFRHHCIPCDNAMGSSIEGPFAESPLAKLLSDPEFLLGVSDRAHIDYNKSLYPFLLLIAFRVGYLHLPRAVSALPAGAPLSPQWRLLHHIRLHIRAYSLLPNKKALTSYGLKPAATFTLSLLPLPVFQACAYSGRDRVDKKQLVSLMTAVSSSFHTLASGDVYMSTLFAPFCIVVQATSKLPVNAHFAAYRVEPIIQQQFHIEPAFIPISREAAESAPSSAAAASSSSSAPADETASFLLLACATTSSHFFAKVQGLLRSWWLTSQPNAPTQAVWWDQITSADQRTTIIKAKSRRLLDSEALDALKLAQLCEMYRHHLIFDFVPADRRRECRFTAADYLQQVRSPATKPHESDISITMQSLVAIASAGSDGAEMGAPLQWLFTVKPLREHAQFLRQRAIAGDRSAQLSLALLLFGAFNLHQGWHPEWNTVVYAHRRLEHHLAAREALRWLRVHDSPLAAFLKARMIFWGYGMLADALQKSLRVAQLMQIVPALQQHEEACLPLLFEACRVLHGMDKDELGRPMRIWLRKLSEYVLESFRNEWRAQGHPVQDVRLGPQFQYFTGGFGEALGQWLQRGHGLLGAELQLYNTQDLSCAGTLCRRMRPFRCDVRPNVLRGGELQSVACTECWSAFYCTPDCKEKHAPLHNFFCASLRSAPTCAVCEASAHQRCGRCKFTLYCSPEHQRDDWPKHKTVCTQFDKV